MSPRYVSGVIGDPTSICQIQDYPHPPEVFTTTVGEKRARWGFGHMSFLVKNGVVIEGSNSRRRWVARETDTALDEELDQCNDRIKRAEAELIAARNDKKAAIEAAIPRLKKVRVQT